MSDKVVVSSGFAYFRLSRKGSRYHLVSTGTGVTTCGKTFSRHRGVEDATAGSINYLGICGACLRSYSSKNQLSAALMTGIYPLLRNHRITMRFNPMDDMAGPATDADRQECLRLALAIVDPGDVPVGTASEQYSLRELTTRLRNLLSHSGRTIIETAAQLRSAIEASKLDPDGWIAKSAHILAECDDETLLECLVIVRENKGKDN